MTESRTSPPETPARVGGRYVLRGELGRGGMATVHLARDEVLDRDVAVKLLHAHLAHDPAFLDRFRREARAAAVLAHPNVVTVHDWGESEEGAFLVLQHVDGCSLREVLRRRARLTPAEALAVLGPAGEGLGAAHAAGLVHRDVKPENLLLSGEGSIQVTDFGLARAAASATSTFGADVLVGSPHYLSPEAVRGEPLEPTADVYALGVVLFECLTGRPPHEGDSPFATAVAHTSRRVPEPSSLVDGVPPALDAVVRRATAPDPGDRYADGARFAAGLTGAVPDGPAAVLSIPGGVPAAPVSRPGRTDTLVAGHDDDLPTRFTRAGDDDPPDDALTWEDGAGWVESGATHPPDPEDPTEGTGPDGDEEASPQRQGGRRRRRGLALLLVLLLLGASLAGGYLLWDRVLAPITAVPSVEEADEQAATRALRSAGFEPVVARDRPHSLEVPAGHVIAYEPRDEARAGAVVSLTISDGPREVELPDLTDQPRDQAVAELEDENLEVEVSDAHDEDVAEGLVVSHSPGPDVVVEETSTVELVVSVGPRPIEVPGLVGTALAEAESQLNEVELELEVTDRRHDDDAPSGQVLSQQPDGSAALTRGDTVEVVVSDGPRPVEVPDVRDRSAGEAVGALESEGFEVVIERRGGIGALFNAGQAIDQDPAPGSTRAPGETVTVYAYEE